MKKFWILIFIILIAPIIGGIYGILHDQLTYTISPEYYTKFKFYQFGLATAGNEAVFLHPRLEVSIVGFMATWWMGLPIGLILGLVGLIHSSDKMLKATLKSIVVTMVVALSTGLIGLAYGWLFLKYSDLSWFMPDNLIDKENFIAVGSMHNFSYLGGLFGLIAGIFYSIKQKNKNALQHSI